MLRTGIAGLGHVSAHHIDALSVCAAFELVACCDPDPDCFVATPDGVERFADIDQMIDRANLDLVVVASPNHMHVEHGIKVLRKGAWLLLEKPAAITREGLNLLRKARADYAGHCSVALHAAFGLEIEWLIANQTAENLRLLSVTSFDSRFYDPYVEDGRVLERALSLGGAWIDSGINALSVIYRLLNPSSLKIINSKLTQMDWGGCSELKRSVYFRFENVSRNGHGSIETNWMLGTDKKLTTLGFSDFDQRLIVDHSAQSVILRSHKNESVLFDGHNQYSRLTNHYIGVFCDLEKQIQSGKDNFSYAATLHDFVYQAASWR